MQKSVRRIIDEKVREKRVKLVQVLSGSKRLRSM